MCGESGGLSPEGTPRHLPGTGVSRSPTLLARCTKPGALRAPLQPARLAPAPAHVSGSPPCPAALPAAPQGFAANPALGPGPRQSQMLPGGCRTLWICVYF